MNKIWCSIICIGSAIHANIEINNQSTYPFKITSITYEHNDGLRKTPFIELNTRMVQPQTNIQLPAAHRDPIRNISGIYINKNYTFDLPPGMQNIIIVITPENQVQLLGPQFMTTNKEFDLRPPQRKGPRHT